jgi:hypothetical protein
MKVELVTTVKLSGYCDSIRCNNYTFYDTVSKHVTYIRTKLLAA